jgi:hypothetical protein
LSGGLSTTAKARVQQWPTIVNRYFSPFNLSVDKDIGHTDGTGWRGLWGFSGTNL